jgi:hypothetical protein
MAKAAKPDGRRKNGRPKGSTNKRSAEAIKKAKRGGIMPLDYMLKAMRDPKVLEARRDEMARAAAPYVHARLQATTVTGNLTLTHEQALQALGG